MTLDTQNRFQHILVHSENSKFLSIRWKGHWYQWKVLPFVFNGSPYFLQQNITAGYYIQHLHQLGLGVVIYVDDIIGLYSWLPMARNLGHQWEVLTFDLPLAEVHAIGWQETRN